MSINLTEKAILEIKKVMQEQKIFAEENVLEVGVIGGGCSGLQYKLGFKKQSEVDPLNFTTFKLDGLDAIVDNRSMQHLNGVVVDFYEGLDKRGFTFNNPNAKSCSTSGGCGTGCCS